MKRRLRRIVLSKIMKKMSSERFALQHAHSRVLVLFSYATNYPRVNNYTFFFFYKCRPVVCVWYKRKSCGFLNTSSSLMTTLFAHNIPLYIPERPHVKYSLTIYVPILLVRYNKCSSKRSYSYILPTDKHNNMQIVKGVSLNLYGLNSARTATWSTEI